MARKRGEGGLFKVGNSRFWYCQWYSPDGRKHKVSTGEDTEAKARAFLAARMYESGQGLPSAIAARKITYGDLRRDFLAASHEKGNRALYEVGGVEYCTGLKALDEFFNWSPSNDGPSADRITIDTMREFTRRRKKDGVGPSSINHSLRCLRRMFRIAHKERPREITIVPAVPMLAEPEARQGFVTPQKFERLLGLLPEALQPTVLLLYTTGVRKGEAAKIDWTQLDLERGLIELSGAQTKNKKPRFIPLHPRLADMLEAFEPKKGRAFSGRNLRRSWERACVVAGLGKQEKVVSERGYGYTRYSGLTLHDLRRSAIKNMSDAGVSEGDGMTVSGHKTRSVYERYNIKTAENSLRAMRTLVQVELANSNAKTLDGSTGSNGLTGSYGLTTARPAKVSGRVFSSNDKEGKELLA
jgi:integrase